MKAQLLVALAVSWASTADADQIRNRFTSEILLASDDRVAVGIPGPRLDATDWTVQFRSADGSEGTICLRRARSTQCLVFDAGRLELAVPTAPLSTWRRTKVPGSTYYRLQPVASPDVFLHNEQGVPAVGRIQPGWWSAMWAFDEKPIADARSVHLAYEAVTHASDFYVEAQVLESHPSSYFAAIVFDGGYLGIQQLENESCASGSGPPTNRQIIFSLWNQDGSPEIDPPAPARALVTTKGAGVNERPFGGEGAGAQTYKCFDWEVNQTYAFLVRSHLDGSRSVYRAYFRAPGDADWTFIAEATRPAGGKRLQGVYSFVEDFGRNGNVEGVAAADRTPFQRRAAEYRNPWHTSDQGSWIPVRQAKFTAWSENQPLTNISAGAPPSQPGHPGVTFRLETGGRVIQGLALDAVITSTAAPSPPPVLPPS